MPNNKSAYVTSINRIFFIVIVISVVCGILTFYWKIVNSVGCFLKCWKGNCDELLSDLRLQLRNFKNFILHTRQSSPALSICAQPPPVLTLAAQCKTRETVKLFTCNNLFNCLLMKLLMMFN